MILRVPPDVATMISLWLQQLIAEPPSASEEAARIDIVRLLLAAYLIDPDNIGLPGTPLRDLWDSMLGETNEEKVIRGVALLWP